MAVIVNKEARIAKIIRDTIDVSNYYEDHRQGGWTTHKEESYSCGNCKRGVSRSSKFCSHCGFQLKGIEDRIEKRRKVKAAPYKKAYDNLRSLRDTFDKNSIEYGLIDKSVKELWEHISHIRAEIL